MCLPTKGVQFIIMKLEYLHKSFLKKYCHFYPISIFSKMKVGFFHPLSGDLFICLSKFHILHKFCQVYKKIKYNVYMGNKI